MRVSRITRIKSAFSRSSSVMRRRRLLSSCFKARSYTFEFAFACGGALSKPDFFIGFVVPGTATPNSGTQQAHQSVSRATPLARPSLFQPLLVMFLIVAVTDLKQG